MEQYRVLAGGKLRHCRLGNYDGGMVVRCEVLGDAHVDWANATKDFTKTFRAFTRVAWGGIPKPQAGTKEGMDGADHATRDDWKITS